MHYLKRMYFTFDGRIGRIEFWIAMVLLQVLSIGATLTLEPNYFTADPTRPLALAGLTLLFSLPELALCIKRINDIEWPAWAAYMLVGASTAGAIALDSGSTVEGSPANVLLALFVLAVALAEFIICGILKGQALSAEAATAR